METSRLKRFSKPSKRSFPLLISSGDKSRPQLLPAIDTLPGQAMSPHAEIQESRAVALCRLASERVPITVTPVASALLRIDHADFYRQLYTKLRVGDEIPLDDLIAHLESVGYEKRDPVEMVGEYSVRGGILDVFPPEASQPLRLELFGDEIESIRRFEVESQRSVMKLNECTLLPLTEFQKSRAMLTELTGKLRDAGMSQRDLPIDGQPFAGWEMMSPLVRKPPSTIFSLLTKPLIIWDEPDLTRSAAERLWKRLRSDDRANYVPPEAVFLEWDELRERTADATQIEMRELDTGSGAIHLSTRPAMSFHGNMPAAIAEARTLVDSGHQVAFFCATTGELERVADIFHEYAVPYQLGLDQRRGNAGVSGQAALSGR